MGNFGGSRLRGIAGRLILAFAVVVLLMGGLTAFSVYKINGVRAQLTEINEVNSRLQRFAINYRGSVHDRAIAIRDVVLTDSTEVRGEALRQIDELARAYAENEVAMAELAGRVGLPAAEQTILQDIGQIQDRTNPLVAEIIQLTAAGENDAAKGLLLNEVSGLFTDWLAAINRFIDSKEADNQEIGALVAESVQTYALTAFTALFIAATLALAAGATVGRSITRPIGRLVDVMNKLASGQLDVVIEGADRGDEIGNMGRAVKVFQDNMVEAERLRADQLSEQKTKEARQTRVETAVSEFDQSASAAIKTVTGSVQTLEELAQSLTMTAEETTDQSARVSAASNEASSNVQSVAHSAEQLSESIQEISQQVSQSASMSKQAVASADETTSRVQSLAEAANRIGDVVNLISDIAEQTNLLALNATIEAARAGDAGKGFAVVASEVKGLAEQTAKATTEIGEQINAMQGATHDAVSAIDAIAGLIKSMDEISTIIAAAIEEQGAATGEISTSVQEAARGAQDVSDNISGVSDTAKRAGEASSQVLSAAAELGGLADELRRDIDQFLGNIKTA